MFVVFYVVRVVHKFDFRIVTNDTPYKLDQWKEGRAWIQTHVSERTCLFPPDHCREREETLTKL